MLSADRDTATTLASEIWPASSTNRTSTASRILADAHSHVVPAARFARRSSSRARTSSVSLPWATASWMTMRSFSPRWTARTSTPSSAAAASTAESRLPMTLWLVAVIPTRLSGGQQGADHPRARVRLARSRVGPGSPACVWSRARARRRAAVEVGLAIAGRADHRAPDRTAAAGAGAGRGPPGTAPAPRCRGRPTHSPISMSAA